MFLITKFYRKNIILLLISGLFICVLLPNAAMAYADISGDVTYSVSGNSVAITIDKISNLSSARKTGTLYVTLWYTTQPNPVGNGFRGARRSLQFISNNGQLGPGTSFINISFTAAYNKPPPGTYYVHLLTSEFPEINSIIDSITFGRRATITSPPPPVPITPNFTNTGGGGGGSGGGGAFTLFNLLFGLMSYLSILVARRFFCQR